MESVGKRVDFRSGGGVADRRVCRAKSVERNYDFPHGSGYTVESIIRLKISPLPPPPSPFKNRLSILARETSGKKFFPLRFVEIVYRGF